MKSTVAFLAVAAKLAAAQDFDLNAILTAPAVSVSGAPIDPVTSVPVYSVNTASLGSSLSTAVTATTASITGAAASAASTQTPTASLAQRDLLALLEAMFGKPSSTTLKTTSTTSSTKCTTSTTSSSVKTTSSTSCATTSTAKSSSASSSSSSSSSSSTSSASATPTGPVSSQPTSNPDACAVQPAGYGPLVVPDNVTTFLTYPAFATDSLTAVTPAGYNLTFQGLTGATQDASYLTYYYLNAYDTSSCAALCDNTTLCTAFNIYIERDPSINPNVDATNATLNCPDPSSITNYKCALYGGSINSTTATNSGQWRDDFEVVITASNGYDKTPVSTPPTVPNWTPPTSCGGKAIGSGGAFNIGHNFFPGPFNPSVCKIFAEAQTAKNKQVAQAVGAHAYTPCNMFNAYQVYKNGASQGTYCSLYDTVLTPSWATFRGQSAGKDWYGVGQSWTYSLSNLDPGKC